MNNKRADELEQLMQQHMFVKEANEKASESSVYKASECLNKAAALFDEAGLTSEAKAVTQALERVLKG